MKDNAAGKHSSKTLNTDNSNVKEMVSKYILTI